MKRIPDVEEVIQKLEAYCWSRNWSGYDPYDALNSEWFARTPLVKSHIARLALTQLLKRSLINFRPLLRIPPTQNPKALALFLMFYVRRAKLGDETARARAQQVAERLLALRSPGTPYWCWGYSFPWQMRYRLAPRFSPNLVSTTFAANALLDAYEAGLGESFLAPAASAGDYVVRELYWRDGKVAAFAYPMPDMRVPVHNANLLGAALLCRLARKREDERALDVALRVARYSVGCQRHDGSWPYGTSSTQQWTDNFHTGYNLVALQSMRSETATGEFDSAVAKGLGFYLDHFFTAAGIPRYFHNRTYPIDIHSVAQSLITLWAFRGEHSQAEPMARRVLEWALTRMWDRRGFFHYRMLRVGPVRTSFMRWAQAWMLLGLVSMTGGSRSA